MHQTLWLVHHIHGVLLVKNNDSSTRRFSNVSTDMFYASGFDEQAIFIIPSKKLLVFRLGLTKTLEGEFGANKFSRNVISLIKYQFCIRLFWHV